MTGVNAPQRRRDLGRRDVDALAVRRCPPTTTCSGTTSDAVRADDIDAAGMPCESVTIATLTSALRRVTARPRLSRDDVDQLRRPDDDRADARPSSAATTFGAASASSRRSSSPMSAGTSSRSRTLPLIWTTQVTVSSTSSAGSATGNGANVSDAVVAQPAPQLLGDVRRERRDHQHQRLGDLARHARRSLVRALFSSISLAMAVLKRRPS